MTHTDANLAEFDHMGWSVERGLLPSTVTDDLSSWVDEVASWATTGGPGLHHHGLTDHGPALARSELFADHHEPLAAFIRGEPIVGVLEQLFGEPPVLFKEKVNYKAAGGAGFAPHQDATAYRFVDHHISVMVPLDEANVSSGCLWFATPVPDRVLPTNGRGRVDPVVVDALDWQPVEVEPGDLVFFDSYAPHYSDTNETARSRRALYLTYNAVSAGDLRSRYYEDKLGELGNEGGTFGNGQRVRMSVNDDFLGRPVATD